MNTVYLARPIDHISQQTAHNYKILTEQIRQSNQSLLIYEPARAFSLGEYTTPNTQINTINNAALATADLLLVLWFKNSKSWGVPAEVQQAIDQQKPILFVTDLQQHQLGWAAQYNPEQVTLLQFDQNAELNGNRELARRILRVAKQKITEHQPTNTLQLLPVAKIREGEHAELPTRAYHDDAGLDLYVSQPTQVPPGEFVDVPTNTAIQLPEGTWGLLQGRSSTLRKKKLLVNPGVIDVGYTGELFSGVQNLSDQTVHLQPGERISQLILIPNATENYQPIKVPHLDNNTSRGNNGFGSSGT